MLQHAKRLYRQIKLKTGQKQQHLYSILGRRYKTYQIIPLAEWPPLAGRIDGSYPNILLAEAIFQTILRTGAPEKMSHLARKLQIGYWGSEELIPTTHTGLNILTPLQVPPDEPTLDPSFKRPFRNQIKHPSRLEDDL